MRKSALILFGVLVSGAAAASDCKVTKKQFDTVQPGMTLAEATQLLGCAGEELSVSEMAGHRTVMLKWDGRGSFGANMNAMFQNGKLVTKAQFGLK